MGATPGGVMSQERAEQIAAVPDVFTAIEHGDLATVKAWLSHPHVAPPSEAHQAVIAYLLSSLPPARAPQTETPEPARGEQPDRQAALDVAFNRFGRYLDELRTLHNGSTAPFVAFFDAVNMALSASPAALPPVPETPKACPGCGSARRKRFSGCVCESCGHEDHDDIRAEDDARRVSAESPAPALARVQALEAALRGSLDWLASYPGGGAIKAWEQARAALEGAATKGQD